MSRFWAKISDNGRISIPVRVRKQLGLKPGDSVAMEVVDDELHIRSIHSSIRRAQAIAMEVKKKHPEMSVDHFLAERREDFDE